MRPAAAIKAIEAIHPTVKGIALVIIGSGFFTAMHACVRYISAEMHPFEVGFFRNLFGFLFFVPWMFRVGFGVLRTRRFGLHFLRSSMNAVSMLTWFTALSLLPLAEATSLSLAGPLFVTLGAIFILGEPARLRRWIALGFGAAGTLVIIRPGFQEISLGAMLVLISALSVTGSKMIAKSLVRTDGTATIVAYLSLLMTPIALVPALFVWTWPTFEQLLMLAVMGALGSTGHLCVIRAYKHADVSAVEPVVFTRLIFAAIIGYVAFGEVPDIWIWIGGAMIVAASSYIAQRETAAARRQTTGESAD